VAFSLVGVFHLAQAGHLVGDGVNAGRHVLFAGIDGVLGVLLLARPPGLAAAFAVLTGQQIVSHGGDFVRAWRVAHVIEWSDLAVLVVMPVTLALLVVDARRRRAGARGRPGTLDKRARADVSPRP
jgi:hypothetical protein